MLSFEVANLIAAGEVVDRPSSVIKELVENSIDSGADRITVEIMRGGISFMRVSDNGCGMSAEDMPIAVKRHATSKIHSASDLDGIKTLGFRGEALAAICSVSDVRIISKLREQELGAMYEIHGGVGGEISERGASDGTTVIVENLFANVPARLKFLKKDATEAMSVGAVVEKAALSHPEIAFTFISDGNLKLETSGDGELKSTLRAVFGKSYSDDMLPVDYVREGVRVHGFICAPIQVRSNRNYENFFINGRYVKSRTASAALEQSFASYIASDKFPGCVLNISISCEAVDVNVHPSKLEVKFSNERPVFDAVYYAVRTTLVNNEKRPELEPFDGKRTTPATSFAPKRTVDAFIPVESRNSFRNCQPDIFAANAVSGVSKNDAVPARSSDARLGASSTTIEAGAPMADTSKLGVDDEVTGFEGYVSPGIGYVEPDLVKAVLGGAREERVAAGARLSGADAMPGNEVERRRAGETQANDRAAEISRSAVMSGSDEISAAAPQRGIDYRIVGEIFNSYIIVEKGDVCLMIDKHAAHERYNFERFKRNMYSSGRASVLLAVPYEVMMMSDEVAVIEEYRHEIEAVGFEFETARNTVKLSAVPDGLSNESATAMIEAFAVALLESAGGLEQARDRIFEKALYQASCKASIKAGRVYPREYTDHIVDELMKAPDITYCPHGRPVAFEMKKSALDHKFERS